MKPLQKELAKRQFRVALRRDSKLFSTPSQLSRTEKALAINRSRNSAEPVVRGMGGECFYWRRVVVNWGVLLIEGELLSSGGVAVKGKVVVQLAGGRGWCSILEGSCSLCWPLRSLYIVSGKLIATKIVHGTLSWIQMVNRKGFSCLFKTKLVYGSFWGSSWV